MRWASGLENARAAMIVVQHGMAFVVNNVNCRRRSWTIIDFCMLFNITEDLLAFLVRCDVVLRKNAAVSVCALLFWLNKVGVHFLVICLF